MFYSSKIITESVFSFTFTYLFHSTFYIVATRNAVWPINDPTPFLQTQTMMNSILVNPMCPSPVVSDHGHVYGYRIAVNTAVKKIYMAIYFSSIFPVLCCYIVTTCPDKITYR